MWATYCQGPPSAAEKLATRAGGGRMTRELPTLRSSPDAQHGEDDAAANDSRAHCPRRLSQLAPPLRGRPLRWSTVPHTPRNKRVPRGGTGTRQAQCPPHKDRTGSGQSRRETQSHAKTPPTHRTAAAQAPASTSSSSTVQPIPSASEHVPSRIC